MSPANEFEYKALWALKTLNLNWEKVAKGRVSQLHKLEEVWLRAYESSTLYKEKMKRRHDAKIIQREFRVGDFVLLYNSRLRLFPSKLKSKWSGPFNVTRVFTNGAIVIEEMKTKEQGKDITGPKGAKKLKKFKKGNPSDHQDQLASHKVAF
ncbi:uncharacterized protein LOC125811272 [Solanum verrucosum]|uniref:uncharacterized protein LOC125811272 n=1 Tax=Solanum verrucosum TaxID=315347 RepID=UPI0020D1DE72|nr:uncharacterized protein LOC125811272 [Solanum verrucosum]